MTAEDEKDEKDVQKHEEKSVDEKYRRDPLGSIIWACILIWAGLVFLADNLGMLEGIRNVTFWGQGNMILGMRTWSVIFIGAGVLLYLEVLIRTLVPAYRQPIGGTLIFGTLLVAIGLGNIVNWSLIWPLILIAIGLSVLLRNSFRKP